MTQRKGTSDGITDVMRGKGVRRGKHSFKMIWTRKTKKTQSNWDRDCNHVS